MEVARVKRALHRVDRFWLGVHRQGRPKVVLNARQHVLTDMVVKDGGDGQEENDDCGQDLKEEGRQVMGGHEPFNGVRDGCKGDSGQEHDAPRSPEQFTDADVDEL